MTRRRVDGARLVCSALLTALIVWIVARDYPLVGHDLRYYIPRLLDTLLHLQLNGPLAVQWWTPTFGGGVPAYPNPQHLQHSALQALTYFVNPWMAYLLTTAAVSLLGFHVFARFLERRLGLAPASSTLGAVFFVGNGFFIEHLIVGHVGFQLFPLASVVLFALTDPTRPTFRNACVIALVVVAMLYQAGVYLIVLTAASVLLALLTTETAWPRSVYARRLLVIGVTAFGLAGAMGASKVYAVLAFMRHFPREIDDAFNIGLVQGLVGFLAQLLGVMTFAPLFVLMGVDVEHIRDALSILTGADTRFGMWELDVSLSPVLWILLGAALLQGSRHLQHHGWPPLERRTSVVILALLVVSWLLIEATLARGLVYSVLKPLPILRSLHVNPRLAAAFIMPLAIVAAIVANRWSAQARSRLVIPMLLCLAVASPLSYLLFPPSVHLRSFDVALSIDTYTRIRRGDAFDVQAIAPMDDAGALAVNASSHLPYEPLFGYQLEDFAPQTTLGDVRQIRDGAFNMTNPAGLVFPESNGLRPFQRISANDGANLEAFVHRRQPRWVVPPVQQWLNWLSAGVLFVVVVCALLRPTSPSR